MTGKPRKSKSGRRNPGHVPPPPPSASEARERGRLGGIASGESRRRRISLRAELEELLNANDGMVAKSLVVSMAAQAKAGSVPAFRAIAEMMGELTPPDQKTVVQAPPVVLGLFRPERIAAERARQEARVAELREAARRLDENAPGAPSPVSAPVAKDSEPEAESEPTPLPPDRPEPPPEPPPPPKAPPAIKPAFFAPRR
ncbi:MAG: hypothetical protein ACI4QF_08850 [Kiritimatiellia bacterium]